MMDENHAGLVEGGMVNDNKNPADLSVDAALELEELRQHEREDAPALGGSAGLATGRRRPPRRLAVVAVAPRVLAEQLRPGRRRLRARLAL